MTIRHLFIFKTVCEEESITGAAGKLFMTQPAVSHAVAELEGEPARRFLTVSAEKSD